MNRPLLTLAGLATAAGATVALAGTAHAANCGGQSAAPQPVPYTCELPGKVMSAVAPNGQTISRHVSAVLHADGEAVWVVYTMSAPLPVNAPIRIVHHEGISGAGLDSDQSVGVIPAGQTTATLVDSSPCRAGQVDVKFWDITNGSGDAFRVGGPWITNGTDCTTPTTTVPGETTTTVVVTTVTTVPGAPTTSPAASAPGTSSRTLPQTGETIGRMFLAAFILFLVAAPLLVISKNRGRRQVDES
jgi:LPXTG-motif cell wall-anchored protein